MLKYAELWYVMQSLLKTLKDFDGRVTVVGNFKKYICVSHSKSNWHWDIRCWMYRGERKLCCVHNAKAFENFEGLW